jgi:predicted amidohydrolase YtcJ
MPHGVTFRRVASWLLAGFLASLGAAAQSQTRPAVADLILYNARVWTADEGRPSAEAVAIRGDRIVKVGSNREVLALRGPASQQLDLQGRLVVPGFIDAHTHFESATEWFFDVRLIDVDTEEEMLLRLREAVGRVPPEFWITGSEWGGLTARQRQAAGDPGYRAFEPKLARLDAIAPDRPILLRRHDGAVFVNSEALRRLRVSSKMRDPSGGAFGRDPVTGALTGMLFGTAAVNAERSLPPNSMRKTLVAAKAIVAELNRLGITGIHDIARIDALSQATVFRTHVERSHSNVAIFEALRTAGDLRVRVYPILTLRTVDGLAAHGIKPGSGDELIRYGALKAFVDGTMMFEPWSNNPDYAGDFTMRVVDEATMQNDILRADRLGFDVALHAYGDKAHWYLMNWYERAAAENGPRDRRFRLIHALYPAPAEIERAGRIGAVADVTPYAIVADGPVNPAIGPERSKTAFPLRVLLRHGIRVNLVSDWPGYIDKTEALPLDPLLNIYYAVMRRPVGARPDAKWHIDDALTVEEALRGYTINPAWSSHEETIKGSINEGKLADIVVLSRDILRERPEQLLSTKVLYTIFGGRIVYQAK